MIHKTHRFHGHNSLSYVYRHGQTVRGPMTSLKYASNNRRDSYRLAIVVSKKISKSAVVRNRIRRRLYEAVRQIEPQITEPFDLVITVFSETVQSISSQELTVLVRAQLKQAGVVHATDVAQ